MVTWATAKRRYDKAKNILASAREHIWNTDTGEKGGDNISYQAWDALNLLDAASSRLADDIQQTRKSLDIGDYTPYGGRGWRGRRF